ncbi:MAG: hypothetical protein JXR61_09820 [Prolixibacteraceae bacterium]|nr:hypothetical protein [Prolixibacteraceae bacterium]
MNINNKKKASALKSLFFLVGIFIFLVGVFITVFSLILSLIDIDVLYGIISVGVFSLWYLYFHVADYQYIEFSDEDNKVLLRYYKIIRFGKGEYSSIEFPQNALKQAVFEDSMFGKLSDVTLIVKTKRGMAEFPSVSLSAVPKEDRTAMKTALYDIIHK